MKPNLKIIYCEETKKFCVVDVSRNVWDTITNSSYDFDTALQIKKAFEEGYEKGKSEQCE